MGSNIERTLKMTAALAASAFFASAAIAQAMDMTGAGSGTNDYQRTDSHA